VATLSPSHLIERLAEPGAGKAWNEFIDEHGATLMRIDG
jgi:hypothetical protein